MLQNVALYCTVNYQLPPPPPPLPPPEEPPPPEENPLEDDTGVTARAKLVPELAKELTKKTLLKCPDEYPLYQVGCFMFMSLKRSAQIFSPPNAIAKGSNFSKNS